ncbi:MAG: EAL domain-containing protein, partial [Cyanobacteria bacterium J06555_13]
RLTLDNIHNVFMNIGGSGSTFIIPFLILFNKRSLRFQSIARLSLVFSFFNVNEILMFGLPIILNPFLLIPFVLAPFINLLIALSMIHLGVFTIALEPIPWMSMPLYSAYIASDGSLWAVLTQFVCIIADGVVYFPFLILASRQQAAPMALKQLFRDEKYGVLEPELRQQQNQQLTTGPQQTLSQLTLTQKVLKQMQNGRFELYYQPKVNAQSLEIVGFEALLRLRNRQGNIFPPSFLPVLYEHGLSKTIDHKVIDLAFDNVLYWRSIGLSVPPIAINFDKAFLLDTQAVREFINRASYHHILFDIEITEHTYTAQTQALAAVVSRLKAAGHRVAIDDFGAGYSCLTSLIELEVDEIKLDRKLVVPAITQKKRGELLLESSIRLCHDLGFLVVAEGIETREQLKRAQRLGVDILQGYYLGSPMSHHEMAHYMTDSWFVPAQAEVKTQVVTTTTIQTSTI